MSTPDRSAAVPWPPRPPRRVAGVPAGLLVCWQAALLLALVAIGRPTGHVIGFGIGAAVVVAATGWRPHGRWAHEWAVLWLRYLRRGKRLAAPPREPADGLAVLDLAVPIEGVTDIDIEDYDVAVVSHAYGVVAVLELDATEPAAPRLRLPLVVAPRYEPDAPAVTIQLVRNTAAVPPAEPARTWLAVQVRRDAGYPSADLRTALVAAVRRLLRRLRSEGVTAQPLPQSRLREALRTLTRLDLTAPPTAGGSAGDPLGTEEWRLWWTLDVPQETLAIRSWPGSPAPPADAVLDALALPDSPQTTTVAAQRLRLPVAHGTLRAGEEVLAVELMVRVAGRDRAALAASVRRLCDRLAVTGAVVERLDGRQLPGLAATLPVGGFLPGYAPSAGAFPPLPGPARPRPGRPPTRPVPATAVAPEAPSAPEPRAAPKPEPQAAPIPAPAPLALVPPDELPTAPVALAPPAPVHVATALVSPPQAAAPANHRPVQPAPPPRLVGTAPVTPIEPAPTPAPPPGSGSPAEPAAPARGQAPVPAAPTPAHGRAPVHQVPAPPEPARGFAPVPNGQPTAPPPVLPGSPPPVAYRPPAPDHSGDGGQRPTTSDMPTVLLGVATPPAAPPAPAGPSEPVQPTPAGSSLDRAVRAYGASLFTAEAAQRAYVEHLVAMARTPYRAPQLVSVLAGRPRLGASATAAGLALTLASVREDYTALLSVDTGPVSNSKILAVCRDHTFTVVDLGAHTGEATPQALALSTRIVVVASADRRTTPLTRLTLDRIHQVNPALVTDAVIVVVCRTNRQYRRVIRELGSDRSPQASQIIPIPPDPALRTMEVLDLGRLRQPTREAYLRLAATLAGARAPTRGGTPHAAGPPAYNASLHP